MKMIVKVKLALIKKKLLIKFFKVIIIERSANERHHKGVKNHSEHDGVVKHLGIHHNAQITSSSFPNTVDMLVPYIIIGRADSEGREQKSDMSLIEGVEPWLV
jgi:hypothetical protein